MHKRRTKLAKRVTRVANAIESRGVRATYGLHDRALSNRSARRRFDHARPSLDTAQQRIVDALGRGLRRRPVRRALPRSRRAGTRSSRQPTRSSDETEEGLRREAGGEDAALRRSVKKYLVRKNAWGTTLDAADPWLQLALDPACSTSPTRTSACGRSSSTSTSGTRRRPTTPSASRPSGGTETSTTGCC